MGLSVLMDTQASVQIEPRMRFETELYLSLSNLITCRNTITIGKHMMVQQSMDRRLCAHCIYDA